MKLFLGAIAAYMIGYMFTFASTTGGIVAMIFFIACSLYTDHRKTVKR
jgi:hypothetical protein